MRDFIVLKSAGLIALPKGVLYKNYMNQEVMRWFLWNHYGGW